MSEWDAFPAVGSAPKQDRGTRNRNPGNLKASPWSQRQPGYVGQDSGGFAMFDTPESGEAAQVNLLRSNYAGMSPTQVVNKYAPVGRENSPESVANYINYASRRAGVDPNQPIPDELLADFARGMREFETGQTVNMTDEDFSEFEAFDEFPTDDGEVDIVDEFSEEVATPGSSRENPIDVTDYNQVIQAKKGDWVRLENGDLTRAAGSAVEGQTGEQRAPGIFTRTTNLVDAIGAGATAAAEQIPFLDESVAFTTGLATGEGYQAMRDRQAALRQLDNEQNRGARVAGGVAGFGTGLLAPGAGFVGRGANAASRAGRAAGLGAGYGAIYGAGAAEGGAYDRVASGAEGAALGGLTGGLLQGGIDRLARGRANPASAARRLSREGVQLTPAQMLQETPVVGPLAKWSEDLASGYVPFIGGARERSAESLARAVGNRALGPIGGRVSPSSKTGYEIASDVYKKLGDEYDKVLPRVQAQADVEVLTDLSDLVNRAANDLPADQMSRLERVLDQGVIDRFTSGGVLDGQEFKRMETRLREMSQRYQRGTVDDTILADYFDETRDVIRGLIARQNPAEAEAIQNINRGYANYARLRRATSRPAAQGREGTFTPGELSTSVNQLGTEQQLATRSALMQDLSADARSILPPSMGDTGSGQRAVVGALALGGGGLVNPAIPAAAIGGGALLYSRPMQSALNAVYRATDSRAANEGLQTLLDYARRDPALVPLYQQALDHLQNGGGQQVPPPSARPDVLSQAQAGMPVP